MGSEHAGELIMGELITVEEGELDVLMRVAWCKIRLGLRGQNDQLLLDMGPLGVVDVYLADIRKGTLLALECVSEVQSNGRTITDFGCGLAQPGSDSKRQGFLIPLQVTSSKILSDAWTSYKQLAQNVSILEFLGSVFVMNPCLGEKRVDVCELDQHLQRHMFRWLLSFDGECAICFEDFAHGKYHVCYVCVSAVCHECWRELQRTQRTGNVKCASRCTGGFVNVVISAGTNGNKSYGFA